MSYTVIDFETTGLDYKTEQVIEIGAIKLDGLFNEIGRLHVMVKLAQGKELREYITKLTGITTRELFHGIPEAVALNMLKDFIGDSVVVAHHAPFDLAFLSKAHEPKRWIDTRSLAKQIHPDKKVGLASMCDYYDIDLTGHHRSINDCEATIQLLDKLFEEVHKSDSNIPVSNTLVISPDRPLAYTPKNAEIR